METPRTLTAGIEACTTPDNLRGELDAIIARVLPPAAAKEYAKKIVTDSAFDTPDSLRELSAANLVEMGIPMGHRGRLCRALFDGHDIEPTAAVPGSLPPAAPPAVNVTVSQPSSNKWKLEWPTEATPEAILDWGMTIRANLLERDKDFSDLVWGRFTRAWTDVDPADHTDGSELDIYLSKGLLSVKVPEWAAPLVRNPLQKWYAVQALQTVCRQVFVRTDLSDKELKRRVRDPATETRPGNVALRLASWDSDLSVTVDVRKFTVDEHDMKEALKQMVEGLDAFSPTLEQFANRDTYTAAQLRKRLGEVADGIKVSLDLSHKKKPSKKLNQKALNVTQRQSGRSNREQRAARAVAAVSRAVSKAGGFSSKPKNKKAPALCKLFLIDGNCRFGDKCIFSHGDRNDDLAYSDVNPFGALAELKEASERDQMLAAVARFWDGNKQPEEVFGVYLGVLRQAARLRKTVTKPQMMALLSALSSCGATAAGEALVAPDSRLLEQKPTIFPAERLRVNKKPAKRYSRRSRLRVSHSRSRTAAAATAATAAAKDDGLWDWLSDDDCHFSGALTDTGASGNFIGSQHWNNATNKQPIEPFPVTTGRGRTTVDECGDLPNTGGLICSAPHLAHCPETLLSVGYTCARYGCGYTQDPGNSGARFWHPDHGEEGNVELQGDGVLFRLPELQQPVPWAIGNRKSAVGDLTALIASTSPSWYQEHCERGHPFRPDCDGCVRGRMRQRVAMRKSLKGKVRDLGYVMSVDFTGKSEADLDGHTVALVCCVHGYTDEAPLAREAAYGFVKLLVKRDTASVAEALDAFDLELKLLGQDKSRAIVRFHTDVDKSFLGKVKKLAVRKGWKQTDTGGYRSQANGIVERRIGMLKQNVRTVLLAATGATHYYDQLWGHGMMFANYCTNRNDWSDTLSPFSQLTGSPYCWDKEDHSFGELVIFHVPKENRLGQYQQSGELGLWMRRESASSHSAVIVPIKWDPKQQAWILQKTVTSSTFKVYKGVYPLRSVPIEGAAVDDFEKWIDAAFDPLLHSAAQDEQLDEGESDGDVHEVERVLNSRTTKGKRFYLIKWVGYGRKDATWEPESALDGCLELKQNYEDELRAAVAYPALLRTLDTAPAKVRVDDDSDYELDGEDCSLYSEVVTEEFRAYIASDVGASGSDIGADEATEAVAELIKKQKVGGTVADWMDGYLKEYTAVRDLRLRELSPEEAARVRSQVLVPRLRMILEAKRDGRRKGRLILQGFQEPYSWDGGLSTDSPVAYMTTIRCLLARAGVDDVITSRDVSTAFLQSDKYGPEEDKRFVSYKTHKGAQARYYELLGPLYGQRSASRRWFETIAGWLTAEDARGDDSDLMTEAAKVLENLDKYTKVAEVAAGFGLVQGKNEPCLFRDPATGFTVVIYVDDVLTRGSRDQTERFHRALEKRFKCKEETYLSDDSELDFIGFTVSQETVDGSRHIYLDQETALKQLLSSFDRGKIQLKDIPMSTKQLLHSDIAPIGENEAAQYLNIVIL